MAQFFSYVPAGDVGGGGDPVTLLKSAPTEAELLADPTFDPDQAGAWAASGVTDTGLRRDVTNTKTGESVPAAVCSVA